MSLTTESVDRSGVTDVELAGRVSAGDELAFELMMRRHNRLLYRTARAIVRDDHEAEDCVQEAYLQAYSSMRAFRGDSSLATWLTRIVANQALGKLRKHRTERKFVSLDDVLGADGVVEGGCPSVEPEEPLVGASRREMRVLLERRIDALPLDFRAVFILRELEELTSEETAASLDIPEATVRTRLFRARHMLRRSLAKDIDVARPDAFAFDGERCDRIVDSVLVRLRRSIGPDR